MSNKKKILIIDDEEDICFLVENLLKNEFDVSSSISAKEGLKKLRQEDFELVLLDIMMPEINGYEMCNMVKDEFPHIHIIFLSAKDSMADMIKGFKKGAARYITKPINTEELIYELKTTLKVV